MNQKKILGSLGISLRRAFRNKVNPLGDVLGYSVRNSIHVDIKRKFKITRSDRFLTLVYFVLVDKPEIIEGLKYYYIDLESRFVITQKKNKFIPADPINSKMTVLLISKNEILFNPINRTFYYKKTKRIYSTRDLVAHLQHVQFHIPILYRIEVLLFIRLKVRLFKSISNLLECILYFISGEKVGHEYESRFFIIDSTKEYGGIVKPTPSVSLKIPIFGVDAPIWSIVSYCFVHLSGFIIFYLLKVKPLIIKAILDNNFVSICYLVVSFCLYQLLLPTLMKKIIIILANKYPYIISPRQLD